MPSLLSTASIETGEIAEFSLMDYVVLSLLVALNIGIGLFYAIKDKIQKKENTTEFILGGRSMPAWLVALSLSVTCLSSTSLLGNPRELYLYNTMYLYLCLSIIFSLVLCALIFIPFFYKLGVTTTSEYIEMRFGRAVRILSVMVQIMNTISYLGIMIYAPALALHIVTGLNVWGTVVALGAVATLYTALGGMKAVLLTDGIQWCIIIAGLLAVFIRGSIVSRGFSTAWEKASQTGRVVFDDFNLDPSARHSAWSILVGGTFIWTSLTGVNQAQVQRCLSTSSVRSAQMALLMCAPLMTAVMAISMLSGITMYHFYSECHPDKLITKSDQLFPLYVMDILGHLHGLPGLFVACLFSGSLSSFSSGLNAVTALTFKDILEPYCCANISEFSATVVNKVLVVIYGLAGITVAFLFGNVDGLLQASVAIAGVAFGTLLGLFTLAMFFPWANSKGAFVGALTGAGFLSWITTGAFTYKVSTSIISPLITYGCPWNNHSTLYNATIDTAITTTLSSIVVNTTDTSHSFEGIYRLYTLSYLHYTPVGMVTVVIVGLVVSFITGYTRPSTLDPRLIFPIFDELFPCLPEAVRKPLRFGILHKGKYDAFLAVNDTIGHEFDEMLDVPREENSV